MKEQNQNKIRAILAFGNQEIISQRLRFSSLIKAYDDISWADAQKKERELVRSSMSNEYIDTVRNSMDFQEETGKTKSEVSKESSKEVKTDETPILKLKTAGLTNLLKPDIFADNYLYLETILSDLDFSQPEIGFYLVASKITKPDFTFEVESVGENDFQLLLICYRDEIKERNEQYRFKIHLDTVSRKAYPLFLYWAKRWSHSLFE